MLSDLETLIQLPLRLHKKCQECFTEDSIKYSGDRFCAKCKKDGHFHRDCVEEHELYALEYIRTNGPVELCELILLYHSSIDLYNVHMWLFFYGIPLFRQVQAAIHAYVRNPGTPKCYSLPIIVEFLKHLPSAAFPRFLDAVGRERLCEILSTQTADKRYYTLDKSLGPPLYAACRDATTKHSADKTENCKRLFTALHGGRHFGDGHVVPDIVVTAYNSASEGTRTFLDLTHMLVLVYRHLFDIMC